MSSNESGGQVLDGQQNLVLPLTASRDGQRCTLFFSSEYVQWMNSYWLCFIWCLVELLISFFGGDFFQGTVEAEAKTKPLGREVRLPRRNSDWTMGAVWDRQRSQRVKRKEQKSQHILQTPDAMRTVWSSRLIAYSLIDSMCFALLTPNRLNTSRNTSTTRLFVLWDLI